LQRKRARSERLKRFLAVMKKSSVFNQRRDKRQDMVRRRQDQTKEIEQFTICMRE
jgi:hypothetical protein